MYQSYGIATWNGSDSEQDGFSSCSRDTLNQNTICHDMMLIPSLLSFKTPLLGLVLMTAYVAVSVDSTSSTKPTKRQRELFWFWPLFILGFSVVVTLTSTSNIRTNMLLWSPFIARSCNSGDAERISCFSQISRTSHMPSRSGPPLSRSQDLRKNKAEH